MHAPQHTTLPKLSAKEESDICLACGECCRRYWITVLPTEATQIAQGLKQSRDAFLEERCTILIKLYPKSTPGVLTHASEEFPKSVTHAIATSGTDLAQSYFVVPQVVLKRIDRSCTFLGEGNTCSIYKDRPEPCELFPFIAVPGFEESYPFCGLYHKTWKDNVKSSEKYAKKVREYFQSVDKKGFTKVWKTPPSTGILMLGERQVGTVSLSDVEMMLAKKHTNKSITKKHKSK